MTLTLSALLKDPEYKRYFLRKLKYPDNIYHQAPWQVWAQKSNGRWAGKAFKDYADAFDMVKRIMRNPAYKDVAISSRLLGFTAPHDLIMKYKSDGYDWCIRCRRPVHFVPMKTHHALRNDLHKFFVQQPVCPYCGIREETVAAGGITMRKGF